jgi:hypothetical protein
MSDSVPDGRPTTVATDRDEERAELISVVLTTFLEEGYASAVDQAPKLFTHTTRHKWSK